MLKALVFDFDGVIVDTETQWYYIYRDWLKKVYHYDLSIQDYLVCVGSSSERLFAFLKQKLGTDEDIREFEKQAMAEFIERTRTLPAMEGVTELVTAAKKKGLRLAIATSATRKKPQVHLERLQLLDSQVSDSLLGIHLEGPFLNPKQKAVMKEEFLRLPDIEEFRQFLRV